MDIEITGVELEDGILCVNLQCVLDGETFDCKYDVRGNWLDVSSVPWELKGVVRDSSEWKLMLWSEQCIRPRLADFTQSLSAQYCGLKLSP